MLDDSTLLRAAERWNDYYLWVSSEKDRDVDFHAKLVETQLRAC